MTQKPAHPDDAAPPEAPAAAAAEPAELSDEALDGVAGGVMVVPYGPGGANYGKPQPSPFDIDLD